MKSYSVCFSVSYFTGHNTLYMHPRHNGKVSFFLWLIFHCIYIYIYIYIYTHTHTSHLLYPSIYQWVLRPFHILPTVNNAAKNIQVHIPFWISIFVFFGKISKSGIVGSYGSSNFFKSQFYLFILLYNIVLVLPYMVLIFWGASILHYSIVAAPTYDLTNNV